MRYGKGKGLGPRRTYHQQGKTSDLVCFSLFTGHHSQSGRQDGGRKSLGSTQVSPRDGLGRWIPFGCHQGHPLKVWTKGDLSNPIVLHKPKALEVARRAKDGDHLPQEGRVGQRNSDLFGLSSVVHASTEVVKGAHRKEEKVYHEALINPGKRPKVIF